MNDFEVIDKNKDSDGNIESFLIVWDGGEPELKDGSPENYLLFIEELYELIGGDGVVLSEEPFVAIRPTVHDKEYMLSVDDYTIRTYPKQSEDLLRGVKTFIDSGDLEDVMDVYRELISDKVRRKFVSHLLNTFSVDEKERVEMFSNGWLIDDMYVVNWDAEIYQHNDDSDKHYTVRSSDVVEVNTRHELTTVNTDTSFLDDIVVTINSEKHSLTDMEKEFLTKVKWLLHRKNYHGDIPFWITTDIESSK